MVVHVKMCVCVGFFCMQGVIQRCVVFGCGGGKCRGKFKS